MIQEGLRLSSLYYGILEKFSSGLCVARNDEHNGQMR